MVPSSTVILKTNNDLDQEKQVNRKFLFKGLTLIFPCFITPQKTCLVELIGPRWSVILKADKDLNQDKVSQCIIQTWRPYS